MAKKLDGAGPKPSVTLALAPPLAPLVAAAGAHARSQAARSVADVQRASHSARSFSRELAALGATSGVRAAARVSRICARTRSGSVAASCSQSRRHVARFVSDSRARSHRARQAESLSLAAAPEEPRLTLTARIKPRALHIAKPPEADVAPP